MNEEIMRGVDAWTLRATRWARGVGPEHEEPDVPAPVASYTSSRECALDHLLGRLDALSATTRPWSGTIGFGPDDDLREVFVMNDEGQTIVSFDPGGDDESSSIQLPFVVVDADSGTKDQLADFVRRVCAMTAATIRMAVGDAHGADDLIHGFEDSKRAREALRDHGPLVAGLSCDDATGRHLLVEAPAPWRPTRLVRGAEAIPLEPACAAPMAHRLLPMSVEVVECGPRDRPTFDLRIEGMDAIILPLDPVSAMRVVATTMPNP